MHGLKVLIAGTSRSYLEISKKLLKFHYDNCDVEFAHTCTDCLKKLSENRYDVVLFDNDLDEDNGLEVVESIQKTGSRTPLIIMVEHGDEVKAAKSIERGATDYILKERGYLSALPFTIRKVLRDRNLQSRQTKADRPVGQQRVALPKGYFVLDAKGRILSANTRMESITRYTEEELLELNLVDLLPDDKTVEFHQWLESVNANSEQQSVLKTEIFDKRGQRVCLDIWLTPILDDSGTVLSYRGEVSDMADALTEQTADIAAVDQFEMVDALSTIITTCYDDSLSTFLERIVERACQIFKFQRSTLALLDKRKKLFVKQALTGYDRAVVRNNKNVEVPQEIIDKIFENRFRVKVIYYNQDHRDSGAYLNANYPERRTQNRRSPSKWHDRDLIMVNLINRSEQTFGYISLDKPQPGHYPTRNTFHNLELFGRLVAAAIENYYQFSEVEKQSRRLKQILVTSNIFKLYLSLNDLLKEMVWSVRFSLDFRLVALGLISKRSGKLEIKAVACDDKVKCGQLLNQRFSLQALARLLRPEYKCGKSYLILQQEDVLLAFKQIYFGQKVLESEGRWPAWGMVLVPIKSKEGKIVGLLMADDPGNKRIPSKENLRTLEIMANQVAVAIDNRIMYLNAKNRLERLEHNGQSRPQGRNGHSNPGIKKFIDRFFN